MGEHARLSMSNPRWPVCPGSIREEAQYPDTSGAAAIDGTGSHLLLEMSIKANMSPYDFVGEVIGEGHEDKPDGWLVDPERAKRVWVAYDYLNKRVEELKQQYGTQYAVEVMVETRCYTGEHYCRDDWWGTCDIIVLVGSFYVEIIDYKDGVGWVNANNNTQLIGYAGSERGADDYRLTIIQPKTHPPIRHWDTKWDVIEQNLIKLADAAKLTDDPDAPLVPGKHCQWCKANPARGGHCTKALEKAMNDLVIPGGELLTANVTDLTTDELAKLVDAKDDITKAFERASDELERRLKEGESVQGYTLAPGRSSYVWNTKEEDLVKALRRRRLTLEEIYVKKVISPAQMKKLDKLTPEQVKNITKEFVTEKVGALKLKKVPKQDTKELFQEVKQEAISWL